MTILGLAESFKTMNRPDITQPNKNWAGPTVTFFDGLYIGKYKR